MAILKKVLGIFLILIGPSLIYAISKVAFHKSVECISLNDGLPWLLLATIIIPIGMSIAVIGFLFLKGEYD